MKTVFLNILKVNFVFQVSLCTIVLPMELVIEGIFFDSIFESQIMALIISITIAVARKDNDLFDKDDDSSDLD